MYPFSGIIVRFEDAQPNTTDSKDHHPKADLHVNLWDLRGGHYLDLGMMIHNIQRVGKVVIDLPWTLRHGSVIDLGGKLDNEKLLTAVFNESVSYRSASSENIAHVTLGSGESETKFTLLRLSANGIELEEIVAGDYSLTRVNISIPKEVKSTSETEIMDRAYMRLRFRDVPRAVFITEFHPKDRNLLSSSSITHLLDLRVNVRRGVPDEILLHDPTLKFPKISKIHVFVIVSRDTELPFHSENYKGCRSLEDEAIWNYYLGLPGVSNRQDETIKGYLGYQWSASGKNENQSVKDLVALGRFVRTASSTMKSYKFVALMLWLGAFGSAIWSVIHSGFIATRGSNLHFIESVYAEILSYPWMLWMIFLSVPVLIIHVDAQSARNLLTWAKQNARRLKNNLDRWWGQF